ncbi:MAG: type IX secretion system membrane protein PorP/SprF [Ferruginibacter sp.]
MRKFYCLLFSLCFVGTLSAQQKPYYTQYILNNYILNPAVAGIENYGDLKMSYRNQWTGINGAPVTTYLSYHTPLGNKLAVERTNPTSFGRGGVNVRGKSYWDEYTSPESHHGAGLIIMNDKTGYLSRFSAYASYAYHRPIGVKTSISAGFQAGISNMSLDLSKIVWGSLDPNDPAIGYDNGELSKFMPEVGAGLWLYSSDFFLGISVLNIIPSKAKFVKNSAYGTYYTPHFFASAGYRVQLNDDWSALPSVAIQKISPLPIQVHVNLKVQYQDIFWVGANYRVTDELGGFAGMAGFNISQTFNLGYAYDVSTNSRLRTYSKNTHEIVLGFLLNNRYGDTCPRNIW